MFKNLINSIERRLYGKISLQPVFESFHRIGIRGMNYMQSQEIGKTGEVYAMKYALKKHQPNDSYNLFDVGANKGQFLNEMTKIFDTRFRIFSFEPSKMAYDQLINNISSANINFYNHGFGVKEGNQILYNSGELIGTSFPLHTSDEKQEKIHIKTIDSFCDNIGIHDIFYLKIDVEGGELDVLKGGLKMISQKNIRFIQYEYGPNCIVAKTYLKDFFEFLKDYKIYRIVKDGLRLLKSYDEILEIPLTSNFLAELEE